MHRSAQDLSARRSKDLSRGGARADFLLELSGERHKRGEPRREVEGGEDGEGVAQREEDVAGEGDASLRNGCHGGGVYRSEHARKLRILV